MILADAGLWWHKLPVVNATLNGTSTVLLVIAFLLIKRGRVVAHATVMIMALVTSTAFLSCYLVYHVIKGLHGEAVTTFPQGPWNPWYKAVLYPHLILAIVMLPLIIATVWFAWRRRWRLHHKVASITFPMWLYVSITGVMVYWMLYHLAPTLRH